MITKAYNIFTKIAQLNKIDGESNRQEYIMKTIFNNSQPEKDYYYNAIVNDKNLNLVQKADKWKDLYGGWFSSVGDNSYATRALAKRKELIKDYPGYIDPNIKVNKKQRPK